MNRTVALCHSLYVFLLLCFSFSFTLSFFVRWQDPALSRGHFCQTMALSMWKVKQRRTTDTAPGQVELVKSLESVSPYPENPQKANIQKLAKIHPESHKKSKSRNVSHIGIITALWTTQTLITVLRNGSRRV